MDKLDNAFGIAAILGLQRLSFTTPTIPPKALLKDLSQETVQGFLSEDQQTVQCYLQEISEKLYMVVKKWKKGKKKKNWKRKYFAIKMDILCFILKYQDIIIIPYSLIKDMLTSQ